MGELMSAPREIDVPDFGKMPARWEICPTCDGDGKHVNRAVDGWSYADEWVDLDFVDDYFAGAYDVSCEECNGTGKVLVPDETHCTAEQLTAWHDYLRDIAEDAAVRHAEMMAGC